VQVAAYIPIDSGNKNESANIFILLHTNIICNLSQQVITF